MDCIQNWLRPKRCGSFLAVGLGFSLLLNAGLALADPCVYVPALVPCRIVADLQNGTLDLRFVNPVVARDIWTQTGGTMRYTALAALGHPLFVQNQSLQTLPNGTVSVFDVGWPGVTVRFQLATDSTSIVQGLHFFVVGQAPAPNLPPPPVQTPVITGGTDPGAGSGTQVSDACVKYPNLCPGGR
jgi:hypothetical protein